MSATMSSVLDNDFTTHRMAVPNVFENKLGLAEDLSYLSRMPELCDVTFIVGDKKEPVRAVRAILAARSSVFYKRLYAAARGAPLPVKKRSYHSESRFKVPFLGRHNSPGVGSTGNGDTATASVTVSKCPRNITVDEFEADVFRQLIEYCHTGCVTLNADTILGLMNAADHYGLDELRRVCMDYMHDCISSETVCSLLKSAEKYIQYKATKSLVQRALEYVDEYGEDVLRYPAFLSLPQHVVRLILSRDELQADELTKFQTALKWSRQYVRNNPGSTMKSAMKPFIDTIGFHLIPASFLMQDVRDTNVVPDDKIMTALAFQADPSCVDLRTMATTPTRLRLSMSSLSFEDRSGFYDGLYQSRTESSSASDSQSDGMHTPRPIHSSTFSIVSKDVDDQRSPSPAPADSKSDDDHGNGDNEFIKPLKIHDVKITNDSVDVDDVTTPRRPVNKRITSLNQDLSRSNLARLELNPWVRKSVDDLSDTTHSISFDTISYLSMSTSSSTSSDYGGSFGKADQKVPIVKIKLPEISHKETQ